MHALRKPAFKAGVAGICAYEVATILTGRDHLTVSALCRRHRWLAPVIVGGLVFHLAA